MGPLERSLSAALLLAACPAVSCELPDEGNAPLRRMVGKVKYLPETEAWHKSLPEGTSAQFALLVDSPQKIRGLCYWPVEVRAAGARWNLFHVSADGKHVLVARDKGSPVALRVWRNSGGR